MLSAGDAEADIAALGGDKALGLYALGAAGARVPEWLVLGTDVFDAFASAAELGELIEELRRTDDVDTALEMAGRIRTNIVAADTAFDDAGIRALVRAAHGRLGDGVLAVRSSVPAGAADSFAGLVDSFLNVGDRDLGDRVRDCWISGFSERVVRYCFARNRPPVTATAVLLQRFVAARTSGALCTPYPVGEPAGATVVNAVYGLGTALADGAVDADTVVVDRAGVVVERVVGDKDVEYVPADDMGIEVRQVADSRRAQWALADEDAALLAGRGRALAQALGGPREIEWAIDAAGLWFLQTRLRTTPDHTGRRAARTTVLLPRGDKAAAAVPRGANEPVGAEERRFWAAALTVEGGREPTSPLSGTMAAEFHARVYRRCAHSLGVPEDQIRQMDSWLPYLLGIFHGRLYSNLLHWYRVAGLVPGYSLARPAVPAALGTVGAPPDEETRTLAPFVFGSAWRRAWSRIRTGVLCLRRFLAVDAVMRDFRAEFARLYERYDTVEYRHAEHAYAEYRRLDRDLVLLWGPVTVLELLLPILLGAVLRPARSVSPGSAEPLVESLVRLPAADDDPAAELDHRFGGLRRSLYRHLRTRTVRCVAYRDHLRFCRTQAGEIVDRMVRVMGRDLAARGLLGDSADIVLLTVDELRNCYDGVPIPDLADRITARRVARTADADLLAPPTFTTIGPELTDTELAEQGWIRRSAVAPARAGAVLAGSSAAAGVVDGVAVLVDEPRRVDGGIIVARRADPALVTVLPSAVALVSERGGPLAAVSTVARELGVPAVLQVPDCSRKLRTGMRIRVDGGKGTVTVLSGGGHGDAAG